MYRLYIKRFFDVICSFILLPFIIILAIPIALAIKLDDGGSIMYYSKRLGKDMQPFNMFKFRTMIENAPDIRNVDGTTFNATTDQRVTQVGKFLRSSSLDELPQILNVLLGQMSFIGPRPSPLGDKSIYPDDFFLKFKVKPGITGYSQAKVRNNATMDQRIYLDKYYVENYSFSFDLKVIVMTISTVVKKANINRN